MKNYLKKQKGFMITEVLITALLIVITMVGILPLLFSGTKAVKVSKTRTIISNIVQKEIENFNQENFSTVLEMINKRRNNNSFQDGTSSEKILSSLNINVSNGSISDTLSSGYKGASLTKVYSFLKNEETITDDAIKLSVFLNLNGDEKPITMSSILSRDKIK